MKLSELIKELNRTLLLYGDLEEVYASIEIDGYWGRSWYSKQITRVSATSFEAVVYGDAEEEEK